MTERLTEEQLRANLLFLHDKEPTVQEIIDMHVRVVKLKEENIALRARVAKLEEALNEVRPWVDRRQDDHCNAHGGRSPKLDGLLRTIDASLKDAPQ